MKKITQDQILQILDDALSGKPPASRLDEDEAEAARTALLARVAALRFDLKAKTGSAIPAPTTGTDVLADIQTLAKHIGDLERMLADSAEAAPAKGETLTQYVLRRKGELKRQQTSQH